MDEVEGEAEEDAGTPQAGVNNKYDKFLRLGPLEYYVTQTLLKGRVLDEEVMFNPFIQRLLDRLRFQGRDYLFKFVKPLLHREEIIEFYAKVKMFDGLVVSSKVKEVEMVFDYVKLGEILIVPSEVLEEYV